MTSIDLRRGPLPGLGLALLGLLSAIGLNLAAPGIPALTACVAFGIVFTALPWRRGVREAVQPGLSLASKRLLRIGVVLLGFRLSLGDIAELGWVTLLLIVAVVILTFLLTLWTGRALKLPGHQPLLIAAGFSICGASAIGAMSGVTRSKDEETATPIALVTLCGTLAIAILPLLQNPLSLDAVQFGMWTGASVHDVGQVVATAQIAGVSALAVAVVVKLTRVAMLAPMVAVTGLVLRHRGLDEGGSRPALLPLFVAGFLGAALIRTLFPLSEEFLAAADDAQFVLLGLALVGLGSAVRIGSLIRTGGRAMLVGLVSWVAIAALAYGAVLLATEVLGS